MKQIILLITIMFIFSNCNQNKVNENKLIITNNSNIQEIKINNQVIKLNQKDTLIYIPTGLHHIELNTEYKTECEFYIENDINWILSNNGLSLNDEIFLMIPVKRVYETLKVNIHK